MTERTKRIKDHHDDDKKIENDHELGTTPVTMRSTTTMMTRTSFIPSRPWLDRA